jgi:hypothetical protein
MGLSVAPNVLQVRLKADGMPSMTCMDARHKSLAGFFVRELALADDVSAVAVDAEYAEIEILHAK